MELDGRSERFSVSLLALIILLSLAVGAAGSYFFIAWGSGGSFEANAGQNEDSATPEPPPSTSPSDQLVASGYIVARRQSTIASEVTGRLLEVRVEEGQTVTRGQIVAVLDASLVRANYDALVQRRASLSAVIEARKAELAEAERVYGRIESLAERGFATDADVTRLLTNRNTAQALLRQSIADRAVMKSEIDEARIQIERHVIRSPFSGVVISKNAQAGEIISPISAGGGFTRTGICTLADMASLELEVDVSEQYIAAIMPGQDVEVTLDAFPDRKLTGNVITTVPSADRAKSTIKVRIAFDKEDLAVLPEMSARVKIDTVV